MATGTSEFKNPAAVRPIRRREIRRREPCFPGRDIRCRVAAGGANGLAPQGVELTVERGILEVANLPDLVRAEARGFDPPGGDRVDHLRRPGAPGDQDIHDRIPLLSVERRPFAQDQVGQRGVLKPGEAARGGHRQFPHAQQLLARLAHAGALRLDQRLQRRPALGHAVGGIERGSPDLLQGATVAEQRAEIADAIKHRGVGAGREGRLHSVPIRRFRGLAPSAQAVGQAFQQCAATRRRAVGRNDFEHGVQPLWRRLDLLGQPAGAVALHRGNPGLGDQFDEGVVAGVGQRHERAPQQQRQIVIARVLRAREQRSEDRRTLRVRQPLQRGRQGQSHQGGCVLPGEASERIEVCWSHTGRRRHGREDVGVQRQVLGQQTDGPDAHVFVAIGQQSGEQWDVSRREDMQRPQGSQAGHGVGLFRQE